MNYHLAKKHSKAFVSVVHKCKTADKDFDNFYELRGQNWKEHRAQRSSRAHYVDVAHVMRDVEEKNWKEELETGNTFV